MHRFPRAAFSSRSISTFRAQHDDFLLSARSVMTAHNVRSTCTTHRDVTCVM
jgi:hypothetical protein